MYGCSAPQGSPWIESIASRFSTGIINRDVEVVFVPGQPGPLF
jgi:hypothetical protein